jgi:gamma-glutamylcyclotransferase
MCSGRLRDRVPCEFVAVATLAGYQLRFHKLSKKDGSSKGDAFRTGVATDLVCGVVYDIPASKMQALDAFEGLGYGYEASEVIVTLQSGEKLRAYTYVAGPKYIREGLAPYSWYKAYVHAGAIEHRLPREYIAEVIEPVVAKADPDNERHAEETRKLRAWESRSN